MSREEGGMSSAGRTSGIGFPFNPVRQTLKLSRHHNSSKVSKAPTSIDETHGHVKLGQVELAPIIDVGQVPVFELSA